MELRHLRYFIAVAEEGSLTVAAEKRLHTAQPSLSRQIRDLEYEVGVPLFARSVHGVELTAAGKAFLDHARLALTQADAAIEAARRAGRPEKSRFALGFLTGQEIDWLPEAMRVLRDELPNIDVTVTSDFSPVLAEGLTRGSLDLAFMRRETGSADLVYKTVFEETLVAVLPSDHRLAKLDRIELGKLEGTPFVNVSGTAPELLKIINTYVRQSGLTISTAHEADNIVMAVSMVASTRGFALLPGYIKNFLPWSVVSRPLKGKAPTIDLVVGYHRANASPILAKFISRLNDLIERATKHVPR
ncbi:LysR substrate-binding domain-containing protein [Bradyrhizobium guangzhouense]|uniref:LysR substrate-binding domain-containing protein n=1 Tax=Bradyrhizobium guangzhouense TaxID=1325095 RepID=UPI0010098E4C|nr:LysR substrate-binding domain-containing protein [Bradyrhizobium guangzhouense]RXH17357.1 LysR family transcriptional regulator [Bradyrhizobium guangzhouense]